MVEAPGAMRPLQLMKYEGKKIPTFVLQTAVTWTNIIGFQIFQLLCVVHNKGKILSTRLLYKVSF